MDERRDDRLSKLETRVLDLEREHAKLFTTVMVTEAKVDGLVSTMKSRFDAFDKGQDLILLRLQRLDEVSNRAQGAVLFARFLGISGIIGWVIGIYHMVRGG